jgi:hypothetical protein
MHREESAYDHRSRPLGEYRPAPLIPLRHALRTPRALAGRETKHNRKERLVNRLEERAEIFAVAIG